jgi:gamma-glutamyltranspeptidase / glutathione hydrolase
VARRERREEARCRGGGEAALNPAPMRLSLLLLLAPAVAEARPAVSRGGMVASAHHDASAAGVSMLAAGGNAADAACAAAFTLAVVEPYSSGVGGGGFALVKMGRELAFSDFREVAPARASRDMYLREGAADQALASDGILAAGVPGAVAGYLDLHARYGKLPRARVLEPAIRLADEGFLVTNTFRDAVLDRLELLRRDPEASRIFLVGGEAPPLGHRLVQKDLAATLRALAKDGPDVFYRGRIADALAADAAARGGLVSKEDLARYRVRPRAPLVGSYRGWAIATSPPPSSGGQLLLTILNGMETLPAETPWHDPAALHLYVEVSKRAYADRALLGDPSFVPYVSALVPALVAKERTQVLLQLLGPRATPAADVPPAQAAQLPVAAHRALQPPREGEHTSHLCVVDRDGNAVALTTTVNYTFGAGVVARGTGVLWNDQMDDFAVAVGVPNTYGIVGSKANAVEPGKVPLSSMSPTMVFAGSTTDAPLLLVIGSPGGSRIPTTVAQAIMLHVDHHADVERAIAAGRVHHQHLPDVVRMEPFALEPATVEALRARGHVVEVQEPWSNASAIAIDPATGLRSGAGDPRGEGVALGE